MRPRTYRHITRRVQRNKSNAQPFFQPAPAFGARSMEGGFFGVAPTTVQAQLTVGQPGDAYEQEANAMADRVVGMSPSAVSTVSAASGVTGQVGSTVQRSAPKEEEKLQRAALKEEGKVQRAEMKEEEKIQRAVKPEEEEKVQRAPQEEKDKPTLQAFAPGSGGGTTVGPSTAARLNSTKGGGSPLPAPAQHEMSSAFGHNFSTVRIHNDTEAESLSDDLGAHAFTLGQDVYFNRGKFNPDTKDGKRLLAHELTHVVQQGGSIYRKEDASEPNEDQSVEDSSPIIGPVREENTTHFGNCQGVSVQGVTNSNYRHSYSGTRNPQPSTGCSGCENASCITSEGIISSVFTANPTVSLPSAPSGLNECETAAVSTFINTTLNAHEQQHVAAFNTYIANIQTPYSYKGCRTGLNSYIASIHNGIESSRRAASDAASAALDPFNVNIPCNCPDPETEQTETN